MNKKGFTLAEVLITLAIIGVVAALTMPMLITKIEKTVLVGQLKDSYTVLNKGLALMTAKEGVDDVTETDFWKYSAQNDYASANATFKKYFSTVNPEYTSSNDISTKYEYLDGTGLYYDWCSPYQYYYLANGATVCFRPYYYNVQSEGQIIVDVNGNKKPNKMGRDVFTMAINDGKVASYNTYTASASASNSTCAPGTGMNGSSQGLGCVDRIIQAGWKMEY